MFLLRQAEDTESISFILFYSPSDCSVSVTIPLPLARAPWSRMEKFGVVEVLLEEWLLRPLQALTSLRPTAELYRLKRKITDSPFCRELGRHFE